MKSICCIPATAAVRTLGVFVMRSVLWSLLVSDPYNDLTADLTCHGKSVFTFWKVSAFQVKASVWSFFSDSQQQGCDVTGLEQQRNFARHRILRRIRPDLVDVWKAGEDTGPAQGAHLCPKVEQERELHLERWWVWICLFSMTTYNFFLSLLLECLSVSQLHFSFFWKGVSTPLRKLWG